MLQALIEIDPVTGDVLRRLWRAKTFAETHPNLVPNYDALRRQINNRDRNGMEKSGACVPSLYGFLIDVAKYQAWILQPRKQSEAA